MVTLHKDIKNVGASLVREYLHKKGLYRTLKCMDFEMPRNINSINSRNVLAKALNIEASLKKHKKRWPEPLTQIEVLAQYFLIRQKKKVIIKIKTETLTNGTQTFLDNDKLIYENLFTNTLNIQNNKPEHVCDQFTQTLNLVEAMKLMNLNSDRLSKSSNYAKKEIVMDLMNFDFNNTLMGKHNVIERNDQGEPKSKDDRNFNYMQRDAVHYKEKANSTLKDKERILLSSFQPNTQNDLQVPVNMNIQDATQILPTKPNKEEQSKTEELGSYGIKALGNLDDMANLNKDEENSSLPSENIERCNENKTTFIEDQSNPSVLLSGNWIQLKKLLFGNYNKCPTQWLGQSFNFNSDKLCYGLVQNQGGVCGVLAPVQAFVIKTLLNDCTISKENLDPLRPNAKQVKNALIQALTDILWQAGQNQAVLVIENSECTKVEKNLEAIIGRMSCKSFTSRHMLEEEIMKNFNLFTMPLYNGCLLFVISAILSRGIIRVFEDMDGDCNLIENNGFCSLELVNLLLTGCAASNVFDNSIQIDSCILKGITTRAEVGFLSLYEYYNSCKVGSNLKTPKCPVWVVNSENHFTTLFSSQKELVSNWRAEKLFSLYNYDTMRCDKELKLSIDTTGLNLTNTFTIEKAPLLERCIRTKWNEAIIHWNVDQYFV